MDSRKHLHGICILIVIYCAVRLEECCQQCFLLYKCQQFRSWEVHD